MRYYANTLNLTLNEHAFHKLNPETKKEDTITSPKFETEKDIFDYLNLVYKEPNERLNETSIVLKEEKPKEEEPKEEKPKHIKSSKNTTLKKDQQEENDVIIENIEKFKSNGEQQLYMLSEKLTSMLQHINSIYYNGEEEPLLEDEEYEVLREYILKKYPNNKVAKDQHADTVIPENQVKLPYTMMSMDKVKELK